MKLSMALGYADGFKESAAQAVALEPAGLDTVWVAEAYGFDGVSLMGYLAAVTDRVEIGSGILPIYTRTPSLLAMTAVRLVPLAPFAVVNMVAGAIRIRPVHFVIGTAIGILPGTLVATIFGDQLFAGLRDPRSIDPLSILAILALGGLLAAATWLVRRWLLADSPECHGRPRPID